MIKSGITQIDDFFGGGLRGGFIMDIFGPPASGKTQLVFQICANAVMNGSRILFEDAKGEFRPERILEILKANNEDIELLENINVSRMTNTNEQISHISKIDHDYSLVIIDGITELFSFEYGRTGQSLARSKIFMKYMHQLSDTSISKNIPIIVTNTIRNMGEKEVENLDMVISPFSHVKVRLSKVDRLTKTELTTINKRLEFSFVVEEKGITIES